jgi:hypothetical protein
VNLVASVGAIFEAQVTVFMHLKPIDDPLSMSDIGIDRG